jgi:hypothetical protein
MSNMVQDDITFQRDTIDPIDHVDLVASVNVPKDIAIGRKRPALARQTLQEVEGHATPHGTFQVTKRPQIYLCYAATMSHIIHFLAFLL